jgi:hypothetical protein
VTLLKQMTVGELIEHLSDFPPESPVQIDTEQNQIGGVKYRALGSVQKCRSLSVGGREIGQCAILRFLERVPTPDRGQESKLHLGKQVEALKAELGRRSQEPKCWICGRAQDLHDTGPKMCPGFASKEPGSK